MVILQIITHLMSYNNVMRNLLHYHLAEIWDVTVGKTVDENFLSLSLRANKFNAGGIYLNYKLNL